MPLIYYLCKCGNSARKFYRVSKEALGGIPCSCGLEMKKQLSPPSNSSKIVVDNGVMAKGVEVDLSVVESNKENSTKDFTKEK